MTDAELIEQFECCTLPGDCFHHREHVRVCFLYLSRYPLLDALKRFSQGLQRFAAAQGKVQRYHETITWAYGFLIHDRMSRTEKRQTWDEFAESNADLLIWKDGILNRYYHAETLASELARRTFIFPDRCA
jgi:hypothetical protein